MAAVLYGVGNRLDDSPELLFKLRGVEPKDLIGDALIEATDANVVLPGAEQLDANGGLEDIFDIELIESSPPTAQKTSNAGVKKKAKAKKKAARKTKASAKKSKESKAVKKKVTRKKATKKKAKSKQPAAAKRKKKTRKKKVAQSKETRKKATRKKATAKSTTRTRTKKSR